MKQTITLFLFAMLLGAADNPAPLLDPQAQYGKAILDLANLQTGRLNTLKQIEQINKQYDESLLKLQTAIQTAIQAKQKECADKKPAQQLDEKVLNENGVLACAPKEIKEK